MHIVTSFGRDMCTFHIRVNSRKPIDAATIFLTSYWLNMLQDYFIQILIYRNIQFFIQGVNYIIIWKESDSFLVVFDKVCIYITGNNKKIFAFTWIGTALKKGSKREN